MTIQVENHGSIALLRPMDDESTDWINTNINPEGWQWMGGALAVEPRYVDNIVTGFQDDGGDIA